MPMQVVTGDGFVELRLSGRLTCDLLDQASDPVLSDARRVLIDYSEVTAIDLPTETLVKMARDNDQRDVRIAIFAPTPLTFGWNRQILQLADTREGQTVSVFRDRQLALAWLRSDCPREDFGGSRRIEPPSLAQGA